MNSRPLSGEALSAERRAAAAEVVKARMAELRLSIPELTELSGLSDNTIKDVIKATGNPNKSTLVALSAVLGWAPQYLDDIVHGRAARTATSEVLLDALFVSLVSGLRPDIAALAEDLGRIDAKIGAFIDLATSARRPA
jgi:hypothetical protein